MKEALLVVDMLNDFIADQGVLSCGESGRKIVKSILQEIENYRHRGGAIIWVEDQHSLVDAEFQLFPPHALAGTWGAERIPELQACTEETDIVVKKRRYDGFYGTDLDLYLREKGIRKLALAGVCTHICILYTALHARQLMYEVDVLKDAVASFDEAEHTWGLRQLEKVLGCTIR